jgi:hypothetical protein
MHQISSRAGDLAQKRERTKLKLSNSSEKGADMAVGAVYCNMRSSARFTPERREERPRGMIVDYNFSEEKKSLIVLV